MHAADKDMPHHYFLVQSPAIFGSPGRSQYYSVSAKGNIPTLLCCEGKGYRGTREFWKSIGCSNNGPVTGTVQWGNNLAYPEVYCKGIPTGAFYSWKC